MSKSLPTPERLRQLLDYNPKTGVLTWKPRNGKGAGTFNHCHAGKAAGVTRRDGYIAVKVFGVILPAHRIIWAMSRGEWPECVRHRNRIDTDNRLANLYAGTRASIMEERFAS